MYRTCMNTYRHVTRAHRAVPDWTVQLAARHAGTASRLPTDHESTERCGSPTHVPRVSRDDYGATADILGQRHGIIGFGLSLFAFDEDFPDGASDYFLGRFHGNNAEDWRGLWSADTCIAATGIWTIGVLRMRVKLELVPFPWHRSTKIKAASEVCYTDYNK